MYMYNIRDLDIVFEDDQYNLNFLTPKSTYSTPFSSPANIIYNTNPIPRRPRAGTMPSFIQPVDLPTNTYLLNTLNASNSNGRHRSGSLNLPIWSDQQQSLENDIARTMRSLGLEDEDGTTTNPLFHHQSPPEFHLPSRSLLSGSNRSRSYSVNTCEVNVQQQSFLINRPRASSMGRADRLLTAGLWGGRASPLLVSMREEDEQQTLSLGDSELLANMLNQKEEDQIIYVPAERPYFSQSTPTSSVQHREFISRSLWVGNIDSTITIDILTQVFSVFGPVESVRLLAEKECGFVNFFRAEDAVRAKEEVLDRMGGRIGQCIVRIGFGKIGTEPDHQVATRALWVGHLPNSITPTILHAMFSRFGAIESVRVLSHKNCGFINFETIESAVRARDAVLANEVDVARVGFAKIPSIKQEDDEALSLMDPTTTVWQNEIYEYMIQFGVNEQTAKSFVKDLKIASHVYFDFIPSVPELSVNRKLLDANRLREMRKKIDSAPNNGREEAEAIAFQCMDCIAEISSDYIGNTLVQRLFEKCSEETKTKLLERIAPHLAAISIHKNGTWATQKIIDLAKLPEQVHIINTHLQPYIPPLLLDQFGNYAVQCCLRINDLQSSQFVFDAMVEKLMTIAQGRFGARSMRGILESEYATSYQKKFVAASLCQNAVALSTNTNGALLLSWLIESTDIENRIQAITGRLMGHLPQLCAHKLGSQIIYKLINQTSELVAQEMLLNELLTRQDILMEVLSDQVRGLVFIQKLLSCPALTVDQRKILSGRVCEKLEKLNGPGHKKLLSLLLEDKITMLDQ
ncbi:armadillo-type protein [Cokeromyces recurvatus]|uniref:armadillo-type protein n=1 Tax=Cokeromyces recurvatus TaxID=90255 RepID=UPI00221F7791|nr:armadillo-type protein [Cokeromyces recurvatus]KAI7907837.1 armadillo-type protein [Cokeromyces recurvatus]